MRINDAEISFNESWLFIQFKVYEMNIFNMKMIVQDLLDGNKCDNIPFDTTKLDETNMWFKTNQHSNRVKGCVLLQIGINDEQYKLLKDSKNIMLNTEGVLKN